MFSIYKRSELANKSLQTANLPKYTHAFLLRMFKNSPYQMFINAYPNNVDQMTEVYEKEKQTFINVGFHLFFVFFILMDNLNLTNDRTRTWG
jgi:hypothetical protein